MSEPAAAAWGEGAHMALRAAGVALVAHVPDAGLVGLLRRCADDPSMRIVGLADEREGIPLLAGAWIGGLRGVLLLQSSGVGNLVNMLGLAATGRFPLLMIVTMRGEWGERNPWQVPMAQAVAPVLTAMNCRILSLHHPEEAAAVIEAGAALAFESEQSVAVLVRQRLIGAKAFATAATAR